MNFHHFCFDKCFLFLTKLDPQTLNLVHHFLETKRNANILKRRQLSPDGGYRYYPRKNNNDLKGLVIDLRELPSCYPQLRITFNPAKRNYKEVEIFFRALFNLIPNVLDVMRVSGVDCAVNYEAYRDDILRVRVQRFSNSRQYERTDTFYHGNRRVKHYNKHEQDNFNSNGSVAYLPSSCLHTLWRLEYSYRFDSSVSLRDLMDDALSVSPVILAELIDRVMRVFGYYLIVEVGELHSYIKRQRRSHRLLLQHYLVSALRDKCPSLESVIMLNQSATEDATSHANQKQNHSILRMHVMRLKERSLFKNEVLPSAESELTDQFKLLFGSSLPVTTFD